jgi:hypothetical protein
MSKDPPTPSEEWPDVSLISPAIAPPPAEKKILPLTMKGILLIVLLPLEALNYLPSKDGGTYGRYIATEKRDWIGLKISSFHTK